MKSGCFLFIYCLFFAPFALTSADTPESRSDSHAPIGVMGDHGHKAGEIMLSYRFMAMDMQGLQSGTTSIETADVLKDFMMAPTAMQMQMHTLGAMFAPHDKLTLMVMTNYRLLRMEMEGAHLHKEGDHGHPVGHHEMSSSGIGDAKLEALLTLWKRPHLTLLGNIGISFPTGSISKNGEEGNLLPYPMQLGSGSFEARPGATLFGYYGKWSYGSQLRGTFPLHTNSEEYRHGRALSVTTWGARRLNDWISLSGRFFFTHWGNITGSHPELNLLVSPSHRPDWRGGQRLDLAISSNLMVPTGLLRVNGLRLSFRCRCIKTSPAPN
ncbi:transporter [Candidatus Poribacteria bacterium]|nr:transporter [Candidatus Poribacteria bacterium]MYG07056.1 transporter [Candidatus Poribacteria bacterium]MYK22124.1 transporter [Candidatus Poribacteria bacterium]